ncbi:hypothetical protein AB0I34_05400 [Kribbella sp. NPDC050281]|uniref:hypothetical protein n=1 Tax=Kribbella sp. NPDC050281 TaxID=3155515 RepID=UPI00340BF969
MKRLLLLSSDDRARYAEDVQTALALPAGAPLQFRYRERWVTPTLQRAVPSGQAGGLPAIVGFVGSDKSRPFLLPIRYATVARAEYVADMFIFKLRLGGYVNMQPFPLSQPDLMAKSRELISQLESNGKGRFYPASSNFPQMPEEVSDDVPDRWLATARRLALHPTFANSYFLRVAPVETQHGKELRFGSDGRIEAIDGQSLRIVTNLFGEQYAPDAEFKLTCSADDANLRVASDDLYQVSLRYDSVEFWLHSAPQSYDTYSRVKISLASEKAAAVTIPANVPLDLVMRRSKSRTFRRWIAASAGAVLVALPAILGPGSPIQMRIAAALVGAGLLAFSGAVLSSPK